MSARNFLTREIAKTDILTVWTRLAPPAALAGVATSVVMRVLLHAHFLAMEFVSIGVAAVVLVLLLIHVERRLTRQAASATGGTDAVA